MLRAIRGTVPFTLAALLGGALAFVPRSTSPGPAIHRPRSDRLRPTLALQVGHSGRIDCLAFSPDGRTLATGGQDSRVLLWDVASGQTKANLQGHADTVWRLAFAPDGKRLATGSSDNTTRLWDAKTGQLQATFRGASRSLAFSPDGRMLAIGNEGGDGKTIGEVNLWDAQSGQLKATLKGAGGSLAFSPDGRMLAAVSGPFRQGPGEARLWDVRTGQLRSTLKGHKHPVYALAFSPDGHTLATGGGTRQNERPAEGEARLWDAHSGRLKATLQGHKAGVYAFAFCPDGRTVATASMDQPAKLWDLPSGQLKAILQAPSAHPGTRQMMSSGEVQRLAFSPNGKTLATTSPVLRLWDAANGQLKATLQEDEVSGPTLAISFAPDGKILAVGGLDGTVRLWDVERGQPRAPLRGQEGEAETLAFSPDGSTLAAGSSRESVWLWNRQTGQLRVTLRGAAGAVAFFPHGKMLATGSGWSVPPGAGRLWDAQTGQLKATLQEVKFRAGMLAVSPDGKMLASANTRIDKDWRGSFGMTTWGPDRTVDLWDAVSGQLQATLQGHTAPVSALAFSPDGHTLATGSGSAIGKGPSQVILWDGRSGQLKVTLQGTGQVSALAFSPDSNMLAVGAQWLDARSQILIVEVRLWDTQTGQLRATLPGHSEMLFALTFSPDGKTLATATRAEVQLWDAVSGQRKRTLQQQTGARALAFSPDGKIVATCDGDYKVRLWDVTTGKQLPLTALIRLRDFPPDIAHPVSAVGVAVRLHDPRDGRVLATLLPIPSAPAEAAAARPGEFAPRAEAALGGEWFATTPEGYFDCSANAPRYIHWNVGGVLYPAERYLRRFRRPDLVQRALRGERLTAPAITTDDIPPTVRFVGLKNGDPVSGDPMTLTVAASGRRAIKEVELLVNGRPLSPQHARPISVGARPISVGAKPISVGARPIHVGARPVDPSRPIVQQFTFRVPLPLGAPEIHVRALAYDSADLGSDPVEIVLRRMGARPVAGHLYVLCVGVSRYRHADGKGFRNLEFPAADARAIAQRFQQEGKPLYDREPVVHLLTDEQATLAHVRKELRWLQASVRPGQIDTVVIFLSGHGISLKDGHYSFATHETDLQDLQGTSLSGRELREALGGKLTARAVFLFVDTCHSGGLGGRTEDLAQQVGAGVFLLASSSAQEYSYESPRWGHGAFTLALLRSLSKKELEDEGAIRFIDLTGSVRREVKALMKEADRNESEQEPCVPLAGRRLGEPIAQAAR